MTDPQPFRTDNINQVLNTVSGGIASTVRDRIIGAIDVGIGDYLATAMQLSSLDELGTPQVMIRVQTFQTVLDEFRKRLGNGYDDVLKRIGLNIGFNFGISLIKTLRNAQWIPVDFDALLNFWALFDSSAHIGHVRFDYEGIPPDTAVVDARIQRFFLAMGYGADDPLRHADFMLGYLLGTADVASLLWTRWIRPTIYQSPAHAWRAVSCVTRGPERDDVTAFRIVLEPERFEDARDLLDMAINLRDGGNWTDAMLKARIALETALLRIAGHPRETKISFGRLLEELNRIRATLDYESWDLAYKVTSEYAHQVKTHNEVAVLGHLFLVWECIRDGEAVQLSEEQRERLAAAEKNFLLH